MFGEEDNQQEISLKSKFNPQVIVYLKIYYLIRKWDELQLDGVTFGKCKCRPFGSRF